MIRDIQEVLHQVAQAILARDQLVARDHRRHHRVVEKNPAALDAQDLVGDVVIVAVGDQSGRATRV